MIGSLINHKLGNQLPEVACFVTLMIQIGVDPAFRHPAQPNGPGYDRSTDLLMNADLGWSVAPDDWSWRRGGALPEPLETLQQKALAMLGEHDVAMIGAGGGGKETGS